MYCSLKLFGFRRRRLHQALPATAAGAAALSKDVNVRVFDASSSDQHMSSSMRNPSETLPSRQNLSTFDSARLDASRPLETEGMQYDSVACVYMLLWL